MKYLFITLLTAFSFGLFAQQDQSIRMAQIPANGTFEFTKGVDFLSCFSDSVYLFYIDGLKQNSGALTTEALGVDSVAVPAIITLPELYQHETKGAFTIKSLGGNTLLLFSYKNY